MIAIGFAESGGNPDALGDFVGQPGEQLPADAIDHSFYADGPAGLQNYTSIGLWQINMAWNWQLVSGLAGTDDPQAVGEWLQVPENNGAAAAAIYDSQGFGAWATFNSGAYLQYTQAAQQAFNQYPGSVGGFTPPPPSQPSTGTLGGPALALGGAIAGGADPNDWSGFVRVSGSSVSNMAASAVGYASAFNQIAQGS